MCLICIEFQRKNLSHADAFRNALEMSEDDEHFLAVIEMLIDDENAKRVSEEQLSPLEIVHDLREKESD